MMASHPNLGSLSVINNYYGTNMNVLTRDMKNENMERGDIIETGAVNMMRHPYLMRHMSIMAEDSPLLNPYAGGTKRKRSCGNSFYEFWIWYSFQIENRPLVTKVITAGCLVGTANFASQILSHFYHKGIPVPPMNWYQTFEFCLMGLLLHAPVTHYYYLLLDGVFPPTPSPWTIVTIIKLLIDQLIFAPIFLAAVFIFLDVMDGKSIKVIRHHFASDWFSTLVDNWKLWVPASFFNLSFCPPCYRVLFSNIIFFVWSIVLSFLIHPD